MAQMVKNPPTVWDTCVQSLGLEDPLVEGNPLQYSCLENPHGQRSLVGYGPLPLLLFSHVWLFVAPWTAAHQTSLSYHSLSLGACSNSCPLSQWCHPTNSSSVVPFFSCLQSLPGSGSFLINHLYTSGGQSIGTSTTVHRITKSYTRLSD